MALSARVKAALPFFVLIFGGALGLVQFSKVRYTFRNQQVVTNEELEAMGISKKSKEVSLEEEYKKMQDMDVDNWQNIRGPRPWEDTTEYFKEMEAAKKKRAEERQKGNL